MITALKAECEEKELKFHREVSGLLAKHTNNTPYLLFRNRVWQRRGSSLPWPLLLDCWPRQKLQPRPLRQGARHHPARPLRRDHGASRLQLHRQVHEFNHYVINALIM